VQDEATIALEPTSAELIVESARLLDHRSRSRLIPLRLASRGRYIAFQDGEETLVLPLEANITHIGRSALAEVRLEDKRISRDHAIIVRHGSYARLLDNRSANGTFLNGRRVIATNLQSGDVIRLGSVAIQYLEVS
jgi:pSer/pThr/pTyr-binding forkhead associated (FHA) protein